MARRIIETLHVPTSEETESSVWINDDIRPLPVARRTWTRTAFISFWATNQLSLSTWQVGSSLVATGLTVWQSVLCCIIAKIIIALVAVLNGSVGADWHIGFPVVSRSVWGIYLSYLALIQRIVLSIVWFAVQAWTGGLCMTAILASIFPTFHAMKNRFPESAHLTTQQFTGWIVFSLINIPILRFPPEKTRWLLYILNSMTFVTLLGIVIWSVTQAHGAGSLASQSSRIESSAELGWMMVKGITTVIGGIAVGLTNQPDYSRFAKKPGDQVFGQYFSIIVLGGIIPTFGCLSGSATQQIYGEAIWNPPDVALKWLDTDYSATSRAGAFFAGVGLVSCILAVNTMDNAFSFGMDLSGLFPKFINIRRGAYIALILSMAMCPWELLSTAATFISVLSAYSVFLGPMVGLMVADYWIVRRRKLKLTDLYHPGENGIYYFCKGCNWRALGAWVLGFAPLLPGFCNAVNPTLSITTGCTHLYYLAYPVGFAVSFVAFVGLNWLFPPPGLGEIDDDDRYDTFTEQEAARLGMTVGIEGVLPKNATDEVSVNDGWTISKDPA